MKTIANCRSIQEADLIRLRLNAADIQCFIPDETTAGVAPFHFASRVGIRVQVANGDEAAARNVLRAD